MLRERFSLVEKKVSSVTRVVSIVGVIALAALMLVINSEIVSRFLFNAPIKGSNEYASLLLGILIFLTLAHCEYEKGHVAVEVITDRMPKRVQAIVGVLMYLLYVAAACLLTWILVKRGMYLLHTTHEATLTLKWQLYPFYFVGASGFALLAIMAIMQFLKYIGEVAGK